jgi:ketosteroid isomerase-like protein
MTFATTGSSKDQIRALLDERVRAIRDRDAQALTSVCAPDVVSFDALPPLQRLGVEAVRARAEEWLGWYDGPVGYDIRDLRITAGDDTAFASSLPRHRHDDQRVDGRHVGALDRLPAQERQRLAHWS